MIDAGGGEAAPARGKKAAVGGGLGLIVVAVIALITSGGDLSKVLGLLQSQAATTQAGGGSASGTVRENTAEEQQVVDFVAQVLGTTEDVWNQLFGEMGKTYQEPKLIRFRESTNSGCGYQTEQVGPFYCGADDTIYIDLGFFDDLARRHKASGDFAAAYVIAHEVGHHVQNITGVSTQVMQQKRGKSETEANRWSVRQELHADFLAGIWGHYVDREGILDHGDLEEALNAAAQIGDDTLQKRARGYVQPEGFTHGTAEQRARWFRRGFESGDLSVGQQLFELPYERL